jgi:hypothetical protein
VTGGGHDEADESATDQILTIMIGPMTKSGQYS